MHIIFLFKINKKIFYYLCKTKAVWDQKFLHVTVSFVKRRKVVCLYARARTRVCWQHRLTLPLSVVEKKHPSLRY